MLKRNTFSSINEPAPSNISLVLSEERHSLIDNDSAMKHNQKVTFWSIFATCIACLGGFLFGYDLGVVGGMLVAPSFQTYFGIDPNDKTREAEINGSIVCVLQIGCLFGSLMATSTADALGRKYSIMMAAFVFTIGGIFQIIGYSLEVMYTGRVISGLGVGALSMLVPIYVAEIAHQKHRGLLGGLWTFFISTGLASSYWTNYITRRLVDEQDNMLWRIPMIIQVIPAVLLFIGMTFLSETPRWLCAHHKYGQAYQVLSKMRGVEDVKVEMDQIQSSVELEAMGQSASSWKHIFAIENRKRLLIGCSLQGFQQMTGTNLINYFSPIIFRSIGLPSRESELLATGVYGLLKMAVVLIGFSNLIDRYGRRPLLIGGGVALGICMYIVSFCMSRTEMDGGIPSPSTGSLSSTAIIGIAAMYSYAVFFALSWGPCPWLYCSEIYPMNLRAKSTSITTALNWAFNAVIGKVSPIMLATSAFGTYIFFGSWCILGGIFCYFAIPETKGKTLEEINKLFQK